MNNRLALSIIFGFLFFVLTFSLLISSVQTVSAHLTVSVSLNNGIALGILFYYRNLKVNIKSILLELLGTGLCFNAIYLSGKVFSGSLSDVFNVVMMFIGSSVVVAYSIGYSAGILKEKR